MNWRAPQGRSAIRAGGLILALLALAAVAAPLIAPHDPLAVDLGNRLSPPSLTYPLGADHLGRCQLSRIIFGGRISLLAGFAASILAILLGGAWGLAAGLGGRWVDAGFMRAADVGLAFPGLLLALVLVGAAGPSPAMLVASLALTGWAWWARLVRGLAHAAKSQEYVIGGRAMGVRGWRMLRWYLLPSMLPPMAVAAAMKTGWIIAALSALGYLGLGVQPPSPEWGAMLQESRMYMNQAPWLMIAPGAAIFLVVLGCNLLAEGLRLRWQVRRAGW